MKVINHHHWNLLEKVPRSIPKRLTKYERYIASYLPVGAACNSDCDIIKGLCKYCRKYLRAEGRQLEEFCRPSAVDSMCHVSDMINGKAKWE